MASLSKVSFRELSNLYLKKGLSTYKIASQFGCNPKTVYYWLKKNRIKTRPIKKTFIKKGTLIMLYEKKKMSLKQIGALYNMTASGIFKRMKKFDIRLRESWDTNTGTKEPFTGTLVEKAYMIGFRLGDLGIRQSSPETKRVLVGTNTTKKDQIELVGDLFKKYSKVWISKPNNIGVMSFSAILHSSFSFLLPKKDAIEKWIMTNDQTMRAFTAGYVDAEGSFGVYNKRAKFRLGSYDKGILKQINGWLKRNRIKSILEQERKMKIGQNKDFWRITVNEAKSILILYKLLFPYMKHKKRRKDFVYARQNINLRLRNGTIRV